MPPAIGLAIAGIAGGIGSAYGAHAASSASNKAAGIQAQGTADALAFERQQAAEDQRRYNQQIALQGAQWNAQQQQRAPYRAAAAAVLSQRTGVPVAPYQPTFQPSTIGQMATASPVAPRAPMPNTLGMLAQRTGAQ